MNDEPAYSAPIWDTFSFSFLLMAGATAFNFYQV
jgi:hypothetical protein